MEGIHVFRAWQEVLVAEAKLPELVISPDEELRVNFLTFFLRRRCHCRGYKRLLSLGDLGIGMLAVLVGGESSLLG